jgi:hypothetical protein
MPDMAYTWKTRWPGILAEHADYCGVREGEECDCGPIGYRATLDDPESGEPVLSPTLDTLAEARAWRREQREAFDAWTAASEERPTVDSVAQDLLAAAARGSARDRYGRRFDAEGVSVLRWALDGHVHEALGSMPVADVRTRHVQALVDRLDDGGMTQRRVDAVVHALQTLFGYAEEHRLVDSSPAEALARDLVEPDTPAAVGSPAGAMTSATAAAVVPAPAVAPTVAMIPEQVIWTSLKAVTLMFVLIALVLVAESV